MKRKSTILLGKAVKKVAALRGGGSALPGLVVEKLDNKFVSDTLSQLPEGVVLISGTNGKTTTTKIVTELLRASGLRVFTNKTGSNFVRGVAAALLGEVASDGSLPYDIAVLELDEAHAVQFVKHVKPRHVLVLNVMRDQLDRFGEIDHTATLLKTVSQSASSSVVLNKDDPRVAVIADTLDRSIAVRFFGAHTSLRHHFLNDDELHAPPDQKVSLAHTPLYRGDVELTSVSDNHAVFTIDKKTFHTTLRLSGIYNFLNAAGALALCHVILKDKVKLDTLFQALEQATPAFGRGETFLIKGQPLEVILVKNPSGFRLALSSFSSDDTDIMIAINDQYADGRDMSWLWDVDFSQFKSSGVTMVSGIRAYDMALRLQYDDVLIKEVQPKLAVALKNFLQNSSTNHPKRIFCTYTAMTSLRRSLVNYTHVEHIS